MSGEDELRQDPPAADTEQCWSVWRQDDNGNRFVVSTGLTRAAADARQAEFEALGHKQMYWASRQPDGTK